MERDDVINYTTYFWREGSRSKSIENISSSHTEEDSSPETSPFRGFELEPRVLIERYDIEPFRSKSLKFGRKSPNVKLKTLPQLVSDCYVKLVNEDLEQLKKDVLENSRINKLKPTGILNMPLLHCKICEKAYSSEKKLQNHLENKHMLVYEAGLSRKTHKRVSFSDKIIVHKINKYHRCRKCTKIFEQYKSLKTHMKQEHRKRKCYICHYCSKSFVDRMFFKVHIKHHCDVCGHLLPNKRSYMSHRRDICRVVKKYLCKTCENFFFSYMDLKDHSYDHLEDLFVCDICKEQHSSKCAIAHHIRFLHSKRRPKQLYTDRKLGNERLYLCKFCETSSIDKDVLEKHVSLLPDLNNKKRTGYKDYYFCDHCSKKFETESALLQHKWTHFLNTSENSQVQAHKKCQEEDNTAKKEDEIQKIFKVNEKLPILMQPKIVLERIPFFDKTENGPELEDSINVNSKENTESVNSNENINSNENTESFDEGGRIFEIGVKLKKAIVDPKSKKTLISRFQCEKCLKYYSNNYCLNRHILAVHSDYSKLQCHVCEEIFVWPSLLQSHNCIRMNIPEMPFDDARPEIHFDNYGGFGQAGFDELMNISQNEDYMNSVDFEIPAPIVELTEYDNCVNPNVNNLNQNTNYSTPVHNKYKIVMQEVPIEF